MDATTLWLIAGGILLVATVVVGFVAVGRRRALRTGEQPPSLESPPRGWEKPAEDAGDAPSATQVDVRATPQEVEIPDIELAPEAPALDRPEAPESRLLRLRRRSSRPLPSTLHRRAGAMNDCDSCTMISQGLTLGHGRKGSVIRANIAPSCPQA